MRIVMFYHSLLSDWNHGNAHFLRGVVSELMARGHDVQVYEPVDNWSINNLRAENGEGPIDDFRARYPWFKPIVYEPEKLNLDKALTGADLVLVHEWSEHALVAAVGQHRKRGGRYKLLFHDTHHRAITQPDEMARYDLRHYDGVLAFGQVLRDLYLKKRWTRRAWTWHEAADTRVFRPIASDAVDGDLVWVGNWGDNERAAELSEFLIDPVRELRLKATIRGVRYPDPALAALKRARITYGGWVPNYLAPELFARYRVTVHVPRRPYVEAMPGIPTIRVFEALACGIPLVSAPWRDVEGLFEAGKDYLLARTGKEMRRHLRTLLNEPEFARDLAMHGHRTILARHTCAHRVDELTEICAEFGVATEMDRPRRKTPVKARPVRRPAVSA
jgi:spore maturation protein CgeB